MKKSCTLLLQRNLPEVTNEFADNLLKYNSDVTDFYVVESGSDDNNITGHETFHANWEDAKTNGLRTGRGFNFALKSLVEKNLDYEYIMMATGDTKLPPEPVVETLIEEMERYPKMGIITPVVWNWGARVTRFRNKKETLSYGEQIPHICWMFRKKCIDDLVHNRKPDVYGEYLYDGSNFRCYGADTELMFRAYKLDWFFAITSKTSQMEDYSLTDNNFIKMKTDSHSKHRKLMWEEGKEWIKSKYGCNHKNQFNAILSHEYRDFFERNKELSILRY
jgi:hypothetical protein